MPGLKAAGLLPTAQDRLSSHAPLGADEPTAVKIAILLPDRASLRLIRRAAELALRLAEVRTPRGAAIEIAIGLAEPDEERWRRGERQLRQRAPAAVVRHLAWTPVPVDQARRMFAGLDPALDLEGIKEVVVPRDWGWNFQDCALWISLADPSVGPILPLRKIVHYCLGLPERYVPAMVAASIHDPYWTRQAEAFRLWRQATVVTSDATAIPDLVSYAGVRSERTELIPDVFECLPPFAPVAPSDRHRDMLVWVLRGDAVDDLEASLAGLQIYHREGGSLDIVVAHEDVSGTAEHSAVAALPADLRALYDSLERITYRSLEELDRLLVRSGALWSSQIAGGGGEHLLEAERAKLHVLAPSFALTRELVERRGISARLYGVGEVLEIADALKDVERMVDAPVRDQDEPGDFADPTEAFGFLIEWLLASARVS